MNIWKEVDANKRRSAFLVFFFVLVVIALGWLISYYYNSPFFLYLAVFLALIQALLGYYGGDSLILSSSGAQPIEKKDAPQFWNAVENMSIAAGLPMPKVYVVNDPAPNAFATGRDPKHASIAATSGLLQIMDKNELEGVIAHEMSHVGNYDIRLMTIVTVLVSILAILSDIFIRSRWLGFGRRSNNNNDGGGLIAILAIVAIVLAPIVGMIIQLSISRKREFLADADGALLTGYPAGLASALSKISRYNRPVEHVSSATAHLYISNPLGSNDDEDKEPGFFAKLLSTHPPIKERIKLLQEMS